jgi:serine/threonine protein kinase/tetratricopeptide (TPR) repeat protein
MSVLRGRLIAGRFELGDALGAGGVGTVYAARDQTTGADVAVKLMRPSSDNDGLRFTREANLLAELRHPAIVRYLAHGQAADGSRYLAMERLEGEDLAARLRRGPLPIGDALALTRRVADALSTAHARGVIHRDVKPSNVFLAQGDVHLAMLIDFGIARALDTTQRLTGARNILGTPGYMAPEQVRSGGVHGPTVDVFALGCVLYECIAGRPTFEGDHVAALLAKVLLEETAPLRNAAPHAPREVEALVAQMLAKDPAERFADGAAVRDAIDAINAAADTAGTSATMEIASLDAPVGSISTANQASGLTLGERQLVWVVLIANSAARASQPPTPNPLDAPDALDDTVVDAAKTILPSSTSDFANIAAMFHARADRLVDGSLVVTVLARGDARDQAVQAARCALALHAARPTAPIALSTALAERGQRAPMGVVLERAAALLEETSAPTSERAVRIDETTAALLPAPFLVERDAVGLSLQAERDLARATRMLHGKPTPFVGREQELSTLRAALAQSFDEQQARVALVVGEAGTGKSRLREELLEARTGESLVLLGAGDPLRQSAPYGLVAHAVRRHVGLVDTDALADQHARLVADVRADLPAGDVERVADFLSELVGCTITAPGPQLAAARRDPMLMGEQLQRAWIDRLRAMTARGGVTLVLEDVHWADASSIKLIEAALRALRDRPFFVLALARPDVDTTFPRLFSGRSTTRLELSELSSRACERMMRALLPDDVGDAALERLVHVAAGNPLFAEELVRSRSWSAAELPSSVLAIVQSRLAAYDEQTRRILRAASVFGSSFAREGIAALLGSEGNERDVRAALDELLDAEVIVPGDADEIATFAFRHALVREAAYAMLTEADRSLGHRLAARFLSARPRKDAALLAQHFERGDAKEDAARWYAVAAGEALDGNDLDAALSLAERGLACGATGTVRGETLRIVAEVYYWKADYAEARVRGAQALELVTFGSTSHLGTIATYVASSDKLGARDEVLRAIDALIALSPQGDAKLAFVEAAARSVAHVLTAGDREKADALFAAIDREEAAITDGLVLARVTHARAIRSLMGGDNVRFLELETKASKAFEEAGDVRLACATRSNAGYASFELGDYERAEVLLREALATGAERGLANTAAFAAHNLGLVLAARGDLLEAERLERESLEHAQRQGDARLEAGARCALGRIALLAGNAALAETTCREALAVLPESSPLRLTLLAWLSLALLEMGRNEDALEEASEGMCLLSEGGSTEGETLAKVAYAEALTSSGHADEARDVVKDLTRQLASRAAAITDERMRACFLQRVPENARCIALSKTLGLDTTATPAGDTHA